MTFANIHGADDSVTRPTSSDDGKSAVDFQNKGKSDDIEWEEASNDYDPPLPMGSALTPSSNSLLRTYQLGRAIIGLSVMDAILLVVVLLQIRYAPALWGLFALPFCLSGVIAGKFFHLPATVCYLIYGVLMASGLVVLSVLYGLVHEPIRLIIFVLRLLLQIWVMSLVVEFLTLLNRATEEDVRRLKRGNIMTATPSTVYAPHPVNNV